MNAQEGVDKVAGNTSKSQSVKEKRKRVSEQPEDCAAEKRLMTFEVRYRREEVLYLPTEDDSE